MYVLVVWVLVVVEAEMEADPSLSLGARRLPTMTLATPGMSRT